MLKGKPSSGQHLSEEHFASEYIRSLYAKNGSEITFWNILDDLDQVSDELLAELIEEDGRHRITCGFPVRLDRYIKAVPDLFDRCEPVDAAIDVTLRSLCGASRPDAVTVQSLVDEYPQIESLIREAAALNDAMWSTYELRHDFPGPVRPLPQDFGKPMETGEPRYELRELLGSGAFGQVYLAVDRLLSEADRPALVAIKILNPRKRTRWSRERLLEEASKARRIDHPNVVRVLDRGVSQEDEDYITYELVTGGDLSVWLRQHGGRADLRQAVRIASSIARGVQAAHAAGVVHCDLNPGNIILTEEGEPKIADFGVAIRTEETRQREIRSRETGRPIGNKLFISPEQYRCEDGSLTVPSDVYALGGILFTMLTGAFPNGAQLDEIARHHDPHSGRTAAPSARALRRDVDRDLEAICRRALAPAPEDRYSSAGAFADDLDAWLRSEPVFWIQPSIPHIVRLWARRRPAVAAVAALLLVSVIVGVSTGVYLTRERDRIELLRQSEELRAIAAESDRQAQELKAIEAERARQEEEHRAEVERIRAEEESLRNQFAAQRISEVIIHMRELQANRATTQFLPIIWGLQYILEPDILGTPSEPANLWILRFDIVEQLVRQAETDDRARDLEGLLWRTTVAFWLTASGQPDALERADSLLSTLADDWGELLRPNDRWLQYIDAIHHCAVVKRLAVDEGLNELPQDQLAAARASLERTELMLAEDDAGNPLHYLIIETMVDLYALLDEELLLQHAIAKRDHYAAP